MRSIRSGKRSYLTVAAAVTFLAAPAGQALEVPEGITHDVNGLKFKGGAGRGTAGYSISTGGDFDGDGINDILIGAPLWNRLDGDDGHIGTLIPNRDLDIPDPFGSTPDLGLQGTGTPNANTAGRVYLIYGRKATDPPYPVDPNDGAIDLTKVGDTANGGVEGVIFNGGVDRMTIENNIAFTTGGKPPTRSGTRWARMSRSWGTSTATPMMIS